MAGAAGRAGFSGLFPVRAGRLPQVSIGEILRGGVGNLGRVRGFLRIRVRAPLRILTHEFLHLLTDALNLALANQRLRCIRISHFRHARVLGLLRSVTGEFIEVLADKLLHVLASQCLRIRTSGLPNTRARGFLRVLTDEFVQVLADEQLHVLANQRLSLRVRDLFRIRTNDLLRARRSTSGSGSTGAASSPGSGIPAVTFDDLRDGTGSRRRIRGRRRGRRLRLFRLSGRRVEHCS